MKNSLYVFNLALRRQDGKVEQDTIFRDKLFTEDEIKDLSIKFSCSVLVSCVGTFKEATKDFVKENTLYCELPEPKSVEDKAVQSE